MLLAIASMMLITCPSIQDGDTGISGYFVESDNSSNDAEQNDEHLLAATAASCYSRQQVKVHIGSSNHIAKWLQLAVPPPCRAPPGAVLV